MVSAIIVAAGKGIRMNTRLRKQYLAVAGRPILMHTLCVFDDCKLINRIVLVIPEDDFDFCHKNILSSLKLQHEIKLVHGGQQRQDSVYNGISALEHREKTDHIVVIHDGVRPFVHPERLKACIMGARDFGACILGIPVWDTLKSVTGAGYIHTTFERDSVWLAQTPQAFQYDLIKAAHENAKQEGFKGTDDASLVERLGEKVKMINGTRSNIKITTEEDLSFARVMCGSDDFNHFFDFSSHKCLI
ncbi:MAG: 2-C-methyl-D-erythritol 4-phosphate cytidylyltransferase [Desulfobacterales bacterium]|nr:2-C-methyl-D-erythritol 4-phosphate cytidylyltransferase [Desulfobacterales bacterium]